MRTFTSLDELSDAAGEELGTSEWLTIEQERVDQFADATGDHQWIHVDVERAASGPFGGTIAHGYLTLSLIPLLGAQVFALDTPGAKLNYGVNKVRFPAPVPVGSRVRDTVVGPGGHRRPLGQAAHPRPRDRDRGWRQARLRGGDGRAAPALTRDSWGNRIESWLVPARFTTRSDSGTTRPEFRHDSRSRSVDPIDQQGVGCEVRAVLGHVVAAVEGREGTLEPVLVVGVQREQRLALGRPGRRAARARRRRPRPGPGPPCGHGRPRAAMRRARPPSRRAG